MIVVPKRRRAVREGSANLISLTEPKQGIGKLTGDRDLPAEDNLDQAKGKGQQAWGNLKGDGTPR